jgi:hypothetical protein
MGGLLAAVRLIPEIVVALNVIVSPPEQTTPEITTLPVPFEMIPLTVPLNVPEPEPLLNCTIVLAVTFCGLPLPSCACTVTLNGSPGVPLSDNEVNANCVGDWGGGRNCSASTIGLPW